MSGWRADAAARVVCVHYGTDLLGGRWPMIQAAVMGRVDSTLFCLLL